MSTGCALIVGLAIALPTSAWAERRLVVLDFDGPGGSDLSEEVVDMLERDFELISSGKYTKAAQKLGAESMRPADVRRVARKIRADAVIEGEVEKSGREYQVAVRVRSGATGDYIGRPALITASSPKLDTIRKQKIERLIRQALEDLGKPAGTAMDDEELDESAPRSTGDDARKRREQDKDKQERAQRREDRRRQRAAERERADDERDDDRARRRKNRRAERDDDADDDDRERRDRRRDKRSKRRVAERDDELDDDRGDERDLSDRSDDDDDDDDGGDDSRPFDSRSPAAIVSVGGVGMSRQLAFNADAADLEPPGYDGGVVPALLLAGEVYPLAFQRGNESITRDLGVIAVYERVLRIESTVPDMPDIVLPTEQQRVGIGLIFRHTFGTTEASPTVSVSVRYNRSRFEIDRTAAEDMMIDLDVPNVNYAYFDPGVAFRVGLIPKLFLGGEARFLLVTKAGEIQLSTEYGAASVTGFDADLFGEYRVTPRVFARLGAHAMGFAYDFNPDPEDVPDRLDRDGDGTQDVGGAFDRYLGGYLAVRALF